MQVKTRKILYWTGITVLVFVIFGMLIFQNYIGFFVVNVEPACINGKYYYINRLDKKVVDGDYVAFKFKGGKLFKKGTVFLKLVGCDSGQKIVTKGQRYYCNGKYIERSCSWHKGCLAGWLKYDEVIPKGRFFAEGTAWDSYDSKYWGLASKKSIIGRGFQIIGGKPIG